ncbi:MAG: serine/threonine-protein kinase, partial [Actinomycetota bacterium]
MDLAKLKQIEEILDEVLEIPNTERRAWLHKSCPVELREEIESLMIFDSDSENFLKTPALDKVDLLFGNGNLKDKQIGNYKIVREIGHGGMGVVFLAERADETFQKQVAIKVVKHNFAERETLRRFQIERQILANLEHPHIAQLLDGGATEENLPYLVMEYVEGLPLLEFCRHHDLDVKAQLVLFQKICSAVQYAHQHLVIHRDLKPSNILVTNSGEPKLLDFGISKLINTEADATQTQTDFRAFTPDYASPEQIRGDRVSTATDIYSLGVILYELLTDARPFKSDSKNIGEIAQAICENEPTKPSDVATRQHGNTAEDQIRPTKTQKSKTEEKKEIRKTQIAKRKSLKGDLDNIILTALRKEPNRRYASVKDFSEDIGNYLNGMPVKARPNTFFYRSEKFIKRNRAASVVATLLVLSLIGGIITTAWQARIARQERDRTEKS